MEHTVFPIGSVVKVRGMEALVTGHVMDEVKGKMVLHYYLVPFPLGYTGAECVRLAPEQELELLFAGYEDESGEGYTRYLQGLAMATEQCTAKEFRKYWKQAMEKQGKETEV